MSAVFDHLGTRRALLARRGVVVAPAANEQHDERTMQALGLELAALGYVMSDALRERLRTIPQPALRELHAWLIEVLADSRGAGQKHVPLFRRFPDDVPEDTFALWLQRVLVHFFQRDGQPCLRCERTGTTHVFDPCGHVVCDHCFDGSHYSACPICGRAVDPSSPFFQPTETRAPGDERVRFQLLHLGERLEPEARALFEQLCARPQALSPDDTAVLATLLADYGEAVLEWLPPAIPLRENVARVFGTLVGLGDPDAVLARARSYMTTATDVLRLIAAYSGADPSLQGEERWSQVAITVAPPRALSRLAGMFGGTIPPRIQQVPVARRVKRFKVARLGRPLRRALLGMLEDLSEDALIEDMLRHRSYWVWVGQLLHPHEHHARFPKVARAFHIVRRKAPDGTPAPRFRTFHARVEEAAAAHDPLAMIATARARPGELARRLDHTLRLCGDDAEAEVVLATAEELAPSWTTPMLLGLRAHFAARTERAPVRIYWPKGGSVTGVSAHDRRPPLDPGRVERLRGRFEAELLARFGAKPAVAAWLADEALRDIVVPFNERTASSSAVPLTRGSSVPFPEGKTMRLFLHWCEPPNGWTTDLDLSVGFYDEAWEHRGVCSFYQLAFGEIARSSGDRTDAPYPDGASEFVDLDVTRARDAGIRYAVMVVNAYSGLPFSALERAYAGLMLMDDPRGLHFDPRTVELKFQLSGIHGVFLPLVVDLHARRLHWLDVFSKGQLAFNTAASSNKAITRVCPESIAYFASGTRASMYDLALLHAASRTRRVFVRGAAGIRAFTRAAAESPRDFLHRIHAGQGGEPGVTWGADEPLTATLLRGDLALPEGSSVYALFRERLSPNLAASDLLA